MIGNSEINRFEIIDHRPCRSCIGTGINEREEKICEDCQGAGYPGREVIVWDDKIDIDYDVQDGGKTLKVFIHKKMEQ